jgi:hypothetical protein
MLIGAIMAKKGKLIYLWRIDIKDIAAVYRCPDTDGFKPESARGPLSIRLVVRGADHIEKTVTISFDKQPCSRSVFLQVFA